MTRREFYKRLRSTPRVWYVDIHDRIRTTIMQAGEPVPICPVEGVYWFSSLPLATFAHVFTAAAALGLSDANRIRITAAADRPDGPFAGDRAQLLHACGLTTKKPTKGAH